MPKYIGRVLHRLLAILGPMFIRRTQTRSTASGEAYFTHRLVHSRRWYARARRPRSRWPLPSPTTLPPPRAFSGRRPKAPRHHTLAHCRASTAERARRADAARAVGRSGAGSARTSDTVPPRRTPPDSADAGASSAAVSRVAPPPALTGSPASHSPRAAISRRRRCPGVAAPPRSRPFRGGRRESGR